MLSNVIHAQEDYFWNGKAFYSPVKKAVIRTYVKNKENPTDSIQQMKKIICYDTIGRIQSCISYYHSDTLGLESYYKSVPIYVSVPNKGKNSYCISMVMNYHIAAGKELFLGIDIFQYKLIKDTIRVEKEYQYSSSGFLSSYVVYQYDNDTITNKEFNQNSNTGELDTVRYSTNKYIFNEDGTIKYHHLVGNELFQYQSKLVFRKTDQYNNTSMMRHRFVGKWEGNDYENDLTTTIEITYYSQ
jgi:hypothetical protein